MPSDRAKALLATLGSTVAFLICAHALSPFLPDDSFISFRYAENLAHGEGLTFNAGQQPVEGYSNFLWVLLCALVSRIGDLPILMPMVGVALGAVCLLLMALILRNHACMWIEAAIPLALLAVSGPFVLYAVSAMETPLFIALLLCLIYVADLAGPDSWVPWISLAVIGTGLALTRPEGVIAFPIVMSVLALNTKSGSRVIPWLSVTVFIVLVGTYNAWRIHYFGEIFPLPFTSKGSAFGITHAWVANLRALFIPGQNQFLPCGFYYLCLAGLAVLGRYSHRNQLSIAEKSCLALAIAYAAVYFNFVDWMPAQRYFSVLVPLLCIPLARLIYASNRQLRASMCVPVFALSGLILLQLRVDTKEAGARPAMVALGKWLREFMPPDAVLAVSDVGAIPYYSHLYTIDINPKSLTDLKIAHQGFTAQDFFSRNPDIAIFVSFSLTEPRFYPEHEALLSDEKFKRYRMVGVTQYNNRGRCYWVYLRDGVSASSEQLKSFPRGALTY